MLSFGKQIYKKSGIEVSMMAGAEGVEERRSGVVLLEVGLDFQLLLADELDFVAVPGLLVGHFGPD